MWCYEVIQLKRGADDVRPLVWTDGPAKVSSVAFTPNSVQFSAIGGSDRTRVFLNQNYAAGWRSDAGPVRLDPQAGGRMYVELAPGQTGTICVFLFPAWLVGGPRGCSSSPSWVQWPPGIVASRDSRDRSRSLARLHRCCRPRSAASSMVCRSVRFDTMALVAVVWLTARGRTIAGGRIVAAVAVVTWALGGLVHDRGFRARYFADAESRGAIEVSTEYKSRIFTRIDRRLDFSARRLEFPLPFFNDIARFTVPSPAQPDHTRLPFAVNWDGQWYVAEAKTATRVSRLARGACRARPRRHARPCGPRRAGPDHGRRQSHAGLASARDPLCVAVRIPAPSFGRRDRRRPADSVRRGDDRQPPSGAVAGVARARAPHRRSSRSMSSRCRGWRCCSGSIFAICASAGARTARR